MRGAHSFHPCIFLDTGIIPADAGSTRGEGVASEDNGDHPRGCGEHKLVANTDEKGEGIIPADARSTVMAPFVHGITKDHPRGCGEHTTLA